MARLGVTYQDVVNAANHLLGQGKQPTIELIRHFLGTGSSTTIANHLRQWRAEQDGTAALAQKENLPQEMINVMKGLWAQVLQQAQDKITVLEANHQQILGETQQELQKYKANNQRWQQLFNQWTQEKEKMLAEKLTLEQAIEFIQKEKTAFQSRMDAQSEQLREKGERIDELHRLHTQVQMNLEHFREATREQRMIEQQQFEQQKQEFQLEAKSLKDQLVIMRDKVLTSQQQHQSLQQAYTSLVAAQAKLEEKSDRQQQQIIELEKLKNEFQQTAAHWETQCRKAQEIQDEKTIKLIDSQAEVKALAQQLSDAKQQLRDAIDQNKFIAQEKWELAQEKAQMEGQMKQMQKMIS